MNTQSKQAKSKARMVHIRLPEDLHRRLRIRAAEADMTIQDWVTEVVRPQTSSLGISCRT